MFSNADERTIDWSTAEELAFASILEDGVPQTITTRAVIERLVAERGSLGYLERAVQRVVASLAEFRGDQRHAAYAGDGEGREGAAVEGREAGELGQGKLLYLAGCLIIKRAFYPGSLRKIMRNDHVGYSNRRKKKPGEAANVYHPLRTGPLERGN